SDLWYAEATRVAEDDARAPFVLSAGPVVRAMLVHLSQIHHWLLITLHHIVIDGWSTSLFANEFATLYSARQAGRASPLADPPIQYGDFAVWQHEWLRGDVLERQLAYWRQQLDGVAPVDLITDRPRGPATFEGDFLPIDIGAPLVAALRSLAVSAGATLYMVLLAVLDVLLHRLTGQDDIAVGSPIANRTRVELEELIG